MSIDETWLKNIPKEYWSLSNYRATLGHKINHSFTKANTRSGLVYHPRFGYCRTIVATKDIKKHEELWINYGYPVNQHSPGWYLDTYEKEIGFKKSKH